MQYKIKINWIYVSNEISTIIILFIILLSHNLLATIDVIAANKLTKEITVYEV